MENISQYNSLPKRSFNGAFTSHKSVYDDVFGAGPPPKLGGLLAPRLEDYSEIFGGFHASSRSSSSSIPVLNLPLIGDDPELHFDVRSPGFDYTEVFGWDFTPPLPFNTPSFQDLVRQSSGGYDSSHDPWSPAQSGSFSDELEPLAGSDKASHRLSDANGADQSLDDTTHLFNVSHNKSSQTTNETVLTETNHATNCGVVPGPTISDSENPVPWNEEEQYCSSSHATDDSSSSKEFGARVTDENPLQKRGKSSSPSAKPFMTVSDISLRTKPSRLPPPSRPPPALVVKKGEYDAKPEASKSYAFERFADDSALFFDVEVDVSVSSEGTENGNKNVKVVHQSIEGENMLQSHGKETSVSALATEDRIGSTKSTENTSESQEVQFSNHIADSSVAWTEGTEYFEVVDKTICRPAFETIENCGIQMQHTNPDAYIHRRPIDSVVFDQDNKKYDVGKESPRWDDNKNQPEMGREDHELGDNLEIKTQNTRLSNQKELQEIVILNKLTSLYGSNGMVPENIQLVEESATVQGGHETIKGRPEAKDNLNEVEANPSLKASDKKMDIGKRFIDSQITKKSSRKNEEHVVRDEFQRRLEYVEGAETGERIKKIIEQEQIEGARMKGNKNKVNETFEAKENEKNGYEREVKWDSENDVLLEGDQLKSFDGACKVDEGNVIKLGGKLDNPRIWEATQAAVLSEGDSELKTEVSSNIYEPEAGNFNRFSKNKDELQDRNTHCETNNTEESHSLPKHKTDSNTGGICKGVSHIMPNKTFSVMNYSHEPEKIQSTQFIVKKLDVRDSFREPLVNGMKVKDASPVFVHNDDTLSSSKDSISQRIERTEKNTIEQKERDRARRETEMENEYKRKIEEEREREREREKDRMAVDKAALEARERSYAEARERASAEVRQRAMSETRERLEKASMEARLRTERAAVERATAEARQRAAEKSSMANKAAFGSHNRVEKFVSDRFPVSFRSADTRQSSFSSDLHYKSSGTLNGLRNSYSSAHYGAESESPQRCQARLERYRRTAERAANALAEKNKRDLLAQREREERNRVAETIDAEVKRWSSGKEGNLRALLSTLQYILGPGSGWQPVPLTEVITSAAVKKAYRKATLCVHPDKLQQRGATVQQKYICEKVFDLLKEAWNKFNSEER